MATSSPSHTLPRSDLFPPFRSIPFSQQHQDLLKPRVAQALPPDVPHSMRDYSPPNGVVEPNPIPSLPNDHMNEIGSIRQRQPLLLSAPPYGSINLTTQPSIIRGPRPPSPPRSPFPGSMAGCLLGSQQRPLDSGPPYRSPVTAPSPQSQGNHKQSPTVQFGLSLHMSDMNGATIPPLNGLQHVQGHDPTTSSSGSADPTLVLAYQRLSHPSSDLDTSSQNSVNAHQSPDFGGWLAQTQERLHLYSSSDELNQQLASYPPEILYKAKLLADLGDRHPLSFTVNQKELLIAWAAQLTHASPINQFNPIRKMNPWFDPIVVHDGPSLDIT